MQKKKRTTGGNRSQNSSSKGRKRVKKHWIACLFTSEGYGSTKSNQIDILHNTRSSMEELLGEINELTEDAKFCKERGESSDYGDEEEGDGEDDEGEEEEEEEEEGEGEDDEEVEYDAPGELWACKFNSGKFGVDWEKTEKVVRDVLEKSGQELTLTVVERDGDEVTSGESDMDA
jgi:ADP-ribose 1''-phosphate phosphatase